MDFLSAPFEIGLPNTPAMRAWLQGRDMNEFYAERQRLDEQGLVEEDDPRLRKQVVLRGTDA